MLARRLAPWLVLVLIGLVMLSWPSSGADNQTAAPTAAPLSSPSAAGLTIGSTKPAAGARPRDIQLDLGPYFFNPSIVAHRGVYLATARTAHMKRIDRTSWWFNEGYICMSTTPGFEAASCRKFDPWQGRFQECLWGSQRKVAEVDTKGLEDPKLFHWPGRGVYAVFGRKPEALGASPFCVDPIFVQFIVQVVSENTTSTDWGIHHPRELKPGQFAASIYARQPNQKHEPIKEKNWMPFVFQDQLHVVYTIVPHRVWRVSATGHAVQQFLTTNDALLGQFHGEDVHGGPPVVQIPRGGGTDGRQPYYLGILHFFQTFGDGAAKVKVYHHYAYKMEAAAPFRICAVSSEIPLVTRKAPKSRTGGSWTHQRIWKDTTQTAYISGVFLDRDDLLLSYGSSDIDARLLTLKLSELEAMFTHGFDCSGSQVVDSGSGEAAVVAPTPGHGTTVALASGNAGAAPGASSEMHHHRHHRAHHRERRL